MTHVLTISEPNGEEWSEPHDTREAAEQSAIDYVNQFVLDDGETPFDDFDEAVERASDSQVRMRITEAA